MIRLLCNALFQRHFDYQCTSCFFLFNKNINTQAPNKTKQIPKSLVRITTPCPHIGATHFRIINLLPVSESVESSITTTVISFSLTYSGLHSIGIILDHMRHWICLCKKQTQDKELYVFLNRKYGLNLTTALSM